MVFPQEHSKYRSRSSERRQRLVFLKKSSAQRNDRPQVLQAFTLVSFFGVFRQTPALALGRVPRGLFPCDAHGQTCSFAGYGLSRGFCKERQANRVIVDHAWGRSWHDPSWGFGMGRKGGTLAVCKAKPPGNGPSGRVFGTGRDVLRGRGCCQGARRASPFSKSVVRRGMGLGALVEC